ncbi:MAG: sugar phosphate isomerase/epimerase [Phycisphaerae bacterium]
MARKHGLTRREFVKGAAIAAVGGPLALAASGEEAPSARAFKTPAAEAFGWRLGMQAYSFNRYTLFEAIEKTASLGLRYIEAYPGQKLSAERSDVCWDHNTGPEIRQEVKRKLDASGVRLVCYGVVGLDKDEAAARKVFDFAKDMGIETIVSESPRDALPSLDKLCGEYTISIAIHNHPKPSPYWDPQIVLDACQGLSPRIGACADTGHWMRSDVNPVEALRKLQGRIVSLHFKDLNAMGQGAHDVPWGTGQGNVRAMLEELARQRLKAVFSIEYEHNWTSSLPEIARCVAYFEQVAGELAAASSRKGKVE